MYSVDFGSQKLSILKNVYGFQSFRTGQEQVVDSLLAGKKYTCRNADGFGKITMFSDTIPYAWRANNSGITACCTHAGSSSRVAT